MRKIFIFTTGTVITGGPEIAHQLADALNQNGERAFMIYLPLGQCEVPAPYRHYNVRSAVNVEAGSIVVLPECASLLTPQLQSCDIYFWWLSVDGFAIAADIRSVDADEDFQNLRVTRHLYQSEYARLFLASRGVTATRLCDPLTPKFRHAATQPVNHQRRNLLAYDPRRMARTKLILDELNARDANIQTLPIVGYKPAEVQRLLQQTKVFIEFSDHLGKLRMPQEAAANGACVITNQRGSAANDVDVSIPEDCKIDDTSDGFQYTAADKIQELMDDYEQQQPRFDVYRKNIADAQGGFLADVAAIFPVMR